MIGENKLLKNLDNCDVNIKNSDNYYQDNLKNNYINNNYINNNYFDNMLGPTPDNFRVPLQIENWFLSLNRENKEKTVKNFQNILKKNFILNK